MDERGQLYRVIRPLEHGATATWLPHYYELLYAMSFGATSIEQVATTAIRHAHATFRPDMVAVALLDGEQWSVLPYRQNDTVVEPLRIPIATHRGDPVSMCLHALAAGIGFDHVGAPSI